VIERRRPITDKDVPDADVAIATWWETAEWVAALSPAKGAKAHFIQGHEVFPGQPVERVKSVWGLPMHRITISKWLVDLARNTYSDTRVSLVSNSVDTSQFFAKPRTKQAVPTVGLMYSSMQIKGLDVSLKAIELVKKTTPCLRLVSFGLDKPNGSLPLPSDAYYVQCPPQDSIRDLYAQCDVWLCGSRTEGFHLPPLEAMACRCPVVSTRVGGPLDIVEDGRNGFLIDIEDHEGLADRLLRVLRLPDPDWRAMSDAAYATATRFTWEDATALFEQALFAAVKRSNRGDFQTPRTAGSSPR
jgi:glycosyltransferase involved in cell wall biosynthesis